MKCIDVKENLDVLLDGEAGISNKRKIENHLKTCGSCRAEFENLSMIGGILKNNLAVSAPTILDEKVFSHFDNFHHEKPTPTKEKIGWFGIPRFAFAAALLLFALGITSAFQIGKMSAGKINIVMPEVAENTNVNQIKNEADIQKPTIKIVEVPVIKEKIVEVPVVREKIITKTIYVDKNKVRSDSSAKNNFALNGSVKNNGYLTQTDLKDFQPVAESKIKINREANENEK